ncbi:MAG TPA: VCBS repeat-containing protein, partial [Polyangiaceae bacterium]
MDINGDGKLDFVAVGASTSAFLGRGDGTFDAGPISSAGWNAFELTSADFNGDGHADLLGLATTTNGATVLEESDGDGEGNFGAPFARAGAPTIGVFHGPPLAGDANEDGKADVVQDATLLIAGASAATIAWPDACDPSSDPAQIGARALVDLDGDHHLDLAALGSLGACVLYGDGKGSFANGGLVTSSPAGGSTLFVADFDGDGQSDLAIAPPSAATRVMILFNRGSRLSFDSVSLSSPSTAAFAGALTADIDGDGRADW